jgi:threonyl-tRNA synthetase
VVASSPPVQAALRVMVRAGMTAGQALRDGGAPTTGPDATVVARDAQGGLRDLTSAPESDAEVEAVAANSPDGRSVIRHSCAHVLAQAVQQHFPDAKLGIGPPVTDGFYYDFAVDRPFTPEDLAGLEKTMRKIIKAGQRFSRRVLGSVSEAKRELADEPYKLELVDLKGSTSNVSVDPDEIIEVGTGELTIYDNVHPHTGGIIWSDLCRGPHVPTTRYIPAFWLMRTAAAYWRGSERNPPLQRIYGTAWESTEALERHLELLAEAQRRDHRKLGTELDLFSFPDEIGSGLPVFHPRGGTVRRVMEDYSRCRHEEAGYEFVNSPHITKAQLFKTSGHLDWYADAMFPPMHLDEELAEDGTVRKAGQDYYLKPMNCPFRNLIYRSRGRSYRELPLRLFEFGSVYRYERSGVVHSLTRVRGMTQDDAHIYCTPEQLQGEIRSLLGFVLDLLRDFGLDDFYLELSTIQVDFQHPDRFELEYTAPDGYRRQPYMIHRALFGSIERFFGVLTEHYAGAFPAWLAPVQVVGIPIADEHVDHLQQVAKALRARGIRVEVDASDERMQKKIRTHTTQKVPFLLLAGNKDVGAGAVSFRFLDGTQINGVGVEDAVCAITGWVARRENRSPSAPELPIGQS